MELLVVDGANVAWNHGHSYFPSFLGIQLACEKAVKEGYTSVVIFNQRYHEFWAEKIEKLGEMDSVFIAPPLSDSLSDDRVMIDYAVNHKAVLLSNDKFRDHIQREPKPRQKNAKKWVNENVLQYHFQSDELHFGKAGNREIPNLNIVDLEPVSILLQEKIPKGTNMNTIELGEFLPTSFEDCNIPIPSQAVLNSVLDLPYEANVSSIIQCLIGTNSFVKPVAFDGVGNIVNIIGKEDLELNEDLMEEYEKILRGILYNGWIESANLSHEINKNMGGFVRKRWNTVQLL